MHEETLKLMTSKLGPDHPDTLTSRNNLAAAYWRAGRLDRSVPLFEETLKLMMSKLGSDHPETLTTQANLGVNYRDAGRPAEGARLMEQALERAQGSSRRARGPGVRPTATRGGLRRRRAVRPSRAVPPRTLWSRPGSSSARATRGTPWRWPRWAGTC